jgi:hypothetical protein
VRLYAGPSLSSLLLPLLSLQLWVMGLRAADDVKESMRGSAGSHVLVMCVSMLNLLCPPLLPLLSLQLWVMGLRAADDVKESVRGAAGSLVRSLRGISLRIMDAQQSPAAGGQRRIGWWRVRLS